MLWDYLIGLFDEMIIIRSVVFCLFQGVINQAFVKETDADDVLDDGSGAVKDKDTESDDTTHIVRIQVGTRLSLVLFQCR